MRRLGAAAILMAIITVGPSCGGGGDSDVGPSLTGTWSGTVQDSYAGSGTMRVSLAQDGRSFSGTWAAYFYGYNNGGDLSGTLSGTTMTAVMHGPNSSSCPFKFTGTVFGGTRVTGTYAAFTCTMAVTGTVDLRKQ